MSDDISSVHEDFSRESLQLNQDLEKMTEQMENVSVKLSWMAYDMVVLRTSPDLAESLKSLENEFLKCKAMESEGNSTENSEHRTSGGLDYILKQLDLMSELIDQLEVKTQLLQCNLTMCFTHPDKMARLQTDVETLTCTDEGRLNIA
ncbi:hypothetical protein QQF64_007321 [Cirrhinus molitorella]|uniref:Ska2 N-terminal domain-containing protein n=1 Tax=Cirrhinus molitorella TaxID=172907 RepID=A0ABR3MAE6_9TELE